MKNPTFRFFVLQSALNLLLVANAMFFIPKMIGHEIRDYRYAVGYFLGFMVTGCASAFGQIILKGRWRSEDNATVSVALYADSTSNSHDEASPAPK